MPILIQNQRDLLIVCENLSISNFEYPSPVIPSVLTPNWTTRTEIVGNGSRAVLMNSSGRKQGWLMSGLMCCYVFYIPGYTSQTQTSQF